MHFFLAYSNDSLSYLIRENQIFEVLQKNDSLSLAFTMDEGISIKSLNFDNNQTLWVGTNKGIGYYNIKTKEYTGIETNLFNSVSYTSLDEKGILWVCAQNMLFSYNIKENRFIVWSETDGFTPNEILFMFQKRLNKKNIYLGGTDGFVKINTDISYTEKVCPIVEMSNVTFNGYSVLNEIKDNAITIPWNYNSFKISSGLRETDIFRKVLYRYSIVGEDNKYEIESYNSDLSLPSLQPGKYEILLSCNTKSGNYTPIKKY
jgi:Y_Y_Y domain.